MLVNTIDQPIMDALYMSSSTEQNITATSISADSGTFGAINSGSIVNDNTIKTDALTVDGSALVGGNLNVNGAVEVFGPLNVKGGISFNDVAFIRGDGDFVVNGTLTCTKGAIFGNDSIIGTDYLGTIDRNNKKITEGVISAQNLRAANRLLVGDSPFEVNALTRTVLGDQFTASFAKVIATKLSAASSELASVRAADVAVTGLLEATKAKFDLLNANEIQVQSFTATAEFATKGLVVDGSAVISGGVTINGAGRNEGALVVNNFPAVFNWGVYVHHKNGVSTQTLTIIGTTDSEGTGQEETQANKYAFNTAIGVRSKFQGDVLVQDAKVILDNSPLLAEKILVTPISIPVEHADTLQILKSGDGFDVHAESQMTYEAETVATEDDETSGATYRTQAEIKARGAQPYVGRAVDITSPVDALANAKARSRDILARRQARAISVRDMTKAFRVKTGDAQYRLDAGGNVLLRKAIIEQVQASKLSAHEIVADTFRTNNFQMENVAVDGVVTAKDGLSVGTPATELDPASGSTEFYGEIFNYAHVTNKDDSCVEFVDQSTQKFNDGTTLKLASGASLIVDDGAYASLHGEVELDMNKLVLLNSATGRRYRLILRDAVETEGDEPGDIAMEFSEIKEEEKVPVATTVSEGTRARATLRADLEEFQARLKRI